MSKDTIYKTQFLSILHCTVEVLVMILKWPVKNRIGGHHFCHIGLMQIIMSCFYSVNICLFIHVLNNLQHFCFGNQNINNLFNLEHFFVKIEILISYYFEIINLLFLFVHCLISIHWLRFLFVSFFIFFLCLSEIAEAIIL